MNIKKFVVNLLMAVCCIYLIVGGCSLFVLSLQALEKYDIIVSVALMTGMCVSFYTSYIIGDKLLDNAIYNKGERNDK